MRTRRASRPAAALLALASLGAGCSSGQHARSAPTDTHASTSAPTAASTTSPPAPVAPLTGLPQPNGSQLDAPAVVVKIDNVDQARPQTAINEADVVYEELVEGGLTRLAAVYQSSYPKLAGPVRSGRLTDVGIIDDLGHPVFAFAGTNANFYPVLTSQPATPVDPDNYPGLFQRIGYNAPHNLFLDIQAVASKSTSDTPPPALFDYLGSGQAFGAGQATPAASVSVDFPACEALWTWDPSRSRWLRSQNGTPDVGASGAQIAAANVVVLSIPYEVSGYTAGEGVPPTPIPEGVLTGSGRAWFFSGGAELQGTWSRPSLTSPATYSDSSGRPVAFTPGPTWVELLPQGLAPSASP